MPARRNAADTTCDELRDRVDGQGYAFCPHCIARATNSTSLKKKRRHECANLGKPHMMHDRLDDSLSPRDRKPRERERDDRAYESRYQSRLDSSGRRTRRRDGECDHTSLASRISPSRPAFS